MWGVVTQLPVRALGLGARLWGLYLHLLSVGLWAPLFCLLLLLRLLSVCVQERDDVHHLYHMNSLAEVQKLALYSENWVLCAVLVSLIINSFLIILHTTNIFLVIARGSLGSCYFTTGTF